MGILALLVQVPAMAVQSVVLSWNPNSLAGMAGYKIYSGGASRSYTSVIDAGNATNVTLSGLADGSTNYFAATTYDVSTNESAYSAEVMFVVPAATNQVVTVPVNPTPTNSPATNQPPVLHVVTNLTISTNPADVSSVVLSWDASTDAGVAGYQVFIGQASGNYSLTNVSLVNSMVITGLVSGTTNFFAVREYDAASNVGGLSSEIQWLVPFPASPAPTPTNPPVTNQPPVLHVVTNLSISTNPVDVSSVILSWDPSADSDLSGYQVFIGQASGNFFTSRNVYGANSLVVTGLVSGTTYYFNIREFDAAWNASDFASEIHRLVPFPASTVVTNKVIITPVPALNPVNNLTVTTNPADIHSVILSWDPSADTGVTGYQVFGGRASGNYSLTQNVGLVSSLVVTGLVAGTTNFFSVQEHDAASNVGGLSTEVQWYVPLPPVPPVLHVVSNLMVTTNATDIHSILLKWNASTDAGLAGYQVLGGRSNVQYTLTQNVGLASSLAVSGLVSGATYYFAVREYDGALNLGKLSAEVRRIVPVPPVLHSVNGITVVANPVDVTSATLKWNASRDAGLAGYKVFCGKAAGNYSFTHNAGVVSSQVITGLIPGTTYFFTVREYDGAANPGIPSSEVRWLAPLPNVAPTLNTLGNLNLDINKGQQTVNLTGISSGSVNEHQTLKVITASSNPGLIQNLRAAYNSPKTTGSLFFQTAHNKTGTAIITVAVNDGAATNNLVVRSFTVTVVDLSLQAALPKFTSQMKGGRVLKNKPVVFGVAVTGQAPFKYQWKFNGTNLVGQTGATLTIPAANVSNSGAYMVQVSNSAGVTNSSLAMLTVFTNTIPTIVTPVVPQAGQFSFQVPAEAGLKYVVEATTDFQNWTPVLTNTAPFTFTETNAASYTQRYYRSRYLP